jgi:hypothetical protein
MTTSNETKSDSGFGVYLYGVMQGQVGSEKLKEIKGIADKPLRAISYNDLQAIVSDLDSKPSATRDNLLRHAEVLEKLLQCGQLLPARFGLIPNSDEDVSNNFLKLHYQEFVDLLSKLSGKHEVDLKVYWDSKAVLESVAQADQNIQQLRDTLAGKAADDKSVYQKKVQLGEMVHKAVESKRTALKDEATQLLNSLAADYRENKLQAENMVLNMAFLVPEEKRSEFSATLQNLDNKYKGLLTFKVVPDAAPYNFVTAHLTQGTQAAS